MSGLRDDDARVHGDGAIGVGEHGVEVEFLHFRVLLDELRDLEDGGLQRADVRGRLAAKCESPELAAEALRLAYLRRKKR